MTKNLLQKAFQAAARGQAAIKELAPDERSSLEREWDLEHAYYSSVLEGSMVDRKDVEELSSAIK